MTEKTQPEKKFRAGAVCATIWRNEFLDNKTGEASFYRTVTLQRGYKDKEDNWQNTGSLRLNDLPRAALVLQKAYEYIVISPEHTESTEEAEQPVTEEKIVEE